MKKISSLIVFLFFALHSFNYAFAHISNVPLEEPQSFLTIDKPVEEKDKVTNIAKIYSDLIPIDIKFENNLDPYEQQDNYSYARSPYPLIRTVMTMFCKADTIPPGYYLLTPRKINGRTYILFKEGGKVLYSIPTFEEKQIDPEKEYPQPKDPYDSAPFGLRSVWKTFGIISGRRTPNPVVPQHKVDCFAYDDQFYGINIYYKDRIYKTVYKIKNYE